MRRESEAALDEGLAALRRRRSGREGESAVTEENPAMRQPSTGLLSKCETLRVARNDLQPCFSRPPPAPSNKAARAVQAKLPEQAKGQARDKAAEALGMGGRTAEKLLALVQKADGGDPEAREALDAVNEGRMSVDAAYRMAAAPKPERDAASIRKDEQTARDFNWQCKAHALDAAVIRSEHEGRFRLTANNLTETQVSELLERLESFGGLTRTDTAPRPQSFFSQATG